MEWDFGLFLGIVGIEKFDFRIFEIVFKKVGGVVFEYVLYIGDSFVKDYFFVWEFGMYVMLFDRFKFKEVCVVREVGVFVFFDFLDV